MRSNNISKLGKLKKGFTIIELIVVIVIIGILSTIVIISYSSWKQTTAVAQLKSDLSGAVSAMEDYRNYNNGYPTDINSLTTFAKSNGVNVYGGSQDGGSSYCIYAFSSQFSNLYYYIDSSENEKDAQIGTCAPFNLTASAISMSAINLSWDPIDGATNYTLQRDVNSSFTGATTIATQTELTFTSSGLSSGTKYYYRVKATVAGSDSSWSVTASATTTAILPPATPPTPSIAVTLSGSNVLATITPVTCVTGTVQYGIRSRTNDGTWSSYSTWSSTLTASQIANDGVKYGYQAQARCYVDDTSISLTATSTESTYIDPITTPAARTITKSNSGSNTTWSWNATSCPAGTSARYQYRYTISSGYDSGLVATTSTSVTFTTSTGNLTYTVAVQTQCYNSNATSSWSTSASLSYFRPIMSVLVVAGGGGGGTGGGGGGGVVVGSITHTINSWTVTVGGGGAGSSSSGGAQGGSSAFSSITAYGGGGGGGWMAPGGGGGSTGGGGHSGSAWTWPGIVQIGVGGTAYGNLGGGNGGIIGTPYPTGGGGGAGGLGQHALNIYYSGSGGTGYTSSISGVSQVYSAGGGGGMVQDSNGPGFGTWGVSGDGAVASRLGCYAGWANTGGGGGGGSDYINGCNGGSGIVIISYTTGTMTATGGTITTSGGNTIHKFTSTGTFTITG